ncbi:alpha-ketoacid dehydrogenase subunit beta [Geomicrobium sp. JSM 1781026]|uniref:alpha-ketoacid dehydrogenase subunit beta n=1 Tax=Geomicrobium sp. JSM 1781026 TaxID=3344580 RepID=UPI0035C24C31
MSQASALEEKKTKEMTLVGAITSGLEVMLREDERVILLGEDIGTNGGVFRATDGLQLEFGEQRVVDTPLAESGIIGTSIGLAMNGFLPIAEMQFQGFIYPAFQQIVSHAVRMRTRTLSRFTVPLVIRAPYGAGIHAPELHSDSMESLFTHIPGLKVVVPSTPYDAKGLLIASILDPDPVLFMEPMKTYRAYREDVPVEKYIVNIGEASVRQTGEDVTVLAWGNMVRLALEAARDTLEEKGIQSEVIDLRTLDPLDVPTIIASVEKTGRVVVVHEGHQTSGFGAEIIAMINDEALYSLRAPIQRVTGFDVHVPFFSIEQAYIPSAKRIGAAIEHVMNEG